MPLRNQGAAGSGEHNGWSLPPVPRGISQTGRHSGHARRSPGAGRHPAWQSPDPGMDDAGPHEPGRHILRPAAGRSARRRAGIQQYPQVSGGQSVQAHRQAVVISFRSHSRRACGPRSRRKRGHMLISDSRCTNRSRSSRCASASSSAYKTRRWSSSPTSYTRRPDQATCNGNSIRPAACPLRSSREDGRRRSYSAQRDGNAPSSIRPIILSSARHRHPARWNRASHATRRARTSRIRPTRPTCRTVWLPVRNASGAIVRCVVTITAVSRPKGGGWSSPNRAF